MVLLLYPLTPPPPPPVRRMSSVYCSGCQLLCLSVSTYKQNCCRVQAANQLLLPCPAGAALVPLSCRHGPGHWAVEYLLCASLCLSLPELF